MKPGFLFQLVSALRPDRAGAVRPFAPVNDDLLPPVKPVSFKPSRPRGVYSDIEKAAVWAKGQPIVGWDPDEWRVDHRGNPLFRMHYGDKISAFGWEVGLIVDLARGGSQEISNLRPQLARRPEPAPSRFGAPLTVNPFERTDR